MIPELTGAQRDESNTTTRDEIVNRLGRKAHIHVAELSSREAVKRIIPTVTSLGFTPDILLNCAGIQRRHPSERFPDEDWDEVGGMTLVLTNFETDANNLPPVSDP